jgi:hypothetical protein
MISLFDEGKMTRDQIERVCILSLHYAEQCYALEHSCVCVLPQRWTCIYPQAEWTVASACLVEEQATLNEEIDKIWHED